MSSIYKQTYEIYFKNQPNKAYIGVDKYAPVFPSNASYIGHKCWAKDYGDKIISWEPLRTVIEFPNRGIIVFWKKMTINDVLENRFQGQYYRRFSDGSVEHKIGDITHSWGPNESFDRNEFERYRHSYGYYYDSDGLDFSDYVGIDTTYDEYDTGYDSW